MMYSRALALELVTLAEGAYSIETDGDCTLPVGYTPAVPITIEQEHEPFLLASDQIKIWGYKTTVGITGSPVIVFRGTQTGGEWGEDGLALPMESHCGYRVHKGFFQVYTAIRESLAKVLDGELTALFVGHSLGAALATLAWLEFGGDLFTFASPRVTDPVGAKAMWDGQTVRVINTNDIVPNVPPDAQPLWPFRHGGTEIRITGPGELWDKKNAHCLETYRAGIVKAA